MVTIDKTLKDCQSEIITLQCTKANVQYLPQEAYKAK